MTIVRLYKNLKLHKYCFLVLAILLCTTKVSAYIDPGTGGMIISGGLWPLIVAIFLFITGFFSRYLIKPIKKGVLSLWGKIKRKG